MDYHKFQEPYLQFSQKVQNLSGEDSELTERMLDLDDLVATIITIYEGGIDQIERSLPDLINAASTLIF